MWSQFSDNRGVDSGPQPAGSGPRRRRCFRPRSRAGEHQVPAPGGEAGALVLVGGSALLLSWSLHWSGKAHRTGGRPASLGPLPPVPRSPGDASRQPWNRADHAGAPVAPSGGRVKLPIAARWRVPVRRPGRSTVTSGPPPYDDLFRWSTVRFPSRPMVMADLRLASERGEICGSTAPSPAWACGRASVEADER